MVVSPILYAEIYTSYLMRYNYIENKGIMLHLLILIIIIVYVFIVAVMHLTYKSHYLTVLFISYSYTFNIFLLFFHVQSSTV